MSVSHEPDLWLFGYGSLIWRPGFDAQQARPGLLQGWARRFYQGSTDHRGVPAYPGRVVTLIPDPRAHTWGVLYQLHPSEAPAILDALDHREQGGYARHLLIRSSLRADDTPQLALVYVATPENPDYLGPASIQDIAQRILTASGPSGSNLDYLLELERSLRAMGVYDEHVDALVRLARASRAPA